MACCLTAPSHYLNQCWPIIKWRSSEGNFIWIAEKSNSWSEFENCFFFKLFQYLPGANELMKSKFQLNLFIGIQLTIIQHWFWLWLGAEQATQHLSEPMMNHFNEWCIYSINMHQSSLPGPQWVNTLRPRQNGCHFTDDIFKCISLNGNIIISIKISLKFVPKVPIDNNPVLV